MVIGVIQKIHSHVHICVCRIACTFGSRCKRSRLHEPADKANTRQVAKFNITTVMRGRSVLIWKKGKECLIASRNKTRSKPNDENEWKMNENIWFSFIFEIYLYAWVMIWLLRHVQESGIITFDAKTQESLLGFRLYSTISVCLQNK